jgi:hypothetical protein
MTLTPELYDGLQKKINRWDAISELRQSNEMRYEQSESKD